MTVLLSKPDVEDGVDDGDVEDTLVYPDGFDLDDGEELDEFAGLYVERAELVLARSHRRRLAQVGLDPDPLGMLCDPIAQLKFDKGEKAELLVDLVPIGRRQAGRRLKRRVRDSASRGSYAYGEKLSVGGGAGGMLATIGAGINPGGVSSGRSPGSGVRRLPRQQDVAAAVGKFDPEAQVFAIQVLVRTAALTARDARNRLDEILAMLAIFEGENWWRPVGPRNTAWRPYSSVWWRRRSFDLRAERGDFAPARRIWLPPAQRQWVRTEEIAPLLKPATKTAGAANVVRMGGMLPPAPAELPTWRGQPGVLPLGLVTGPDGTERLAGLPALEVLFAALFGKSGFGKTEAALIQLIARAYAGDGAVLIDPHRSGVHKALAFLTHRKVAGRVVVIDLAPPENTARVTCWNPLSMVDKRELDIDEVANSVAEGFAAASHWGNTARRARTIMTIATRTLAEISLRLVRAGHPEAQPTVFQIKDLIEDETWRAQLQPYLSAETRGYWQNTFPKYAADAGPAVTYALDRLLNASGLKTFLGYPLGGYNARTAMADSQVVLLSTEGAGEAKPLITSLLVFDLMRAGLARTRNSRDAMRHLWAWVDEATAVDKAAPGILADILEQLRKFYVHLMIATQSAHRLSDATLEALLQNQSLLSAARCSKKEATLLADEMGEIDPRILMSTKKYEYVMTADLGEDRTTPFRVRGLPAQELYANYHDPDGVDELIAGVDERLQRPTAGEVKAIQAGLKEAILKHLPGSPPLDDGQAAVPAQSQPQPAAPASRPATQRGSSGEARIYDFSSPYTTKHSKED